MGMAEFCARLPVLAGRDLGRPGTIPAAAGGHLGVQNDIRTGQSQGKHSRL